MKSQNAALRALGLSEGQIGALSAPADVGRAVASINRKGKKPDLDLRKTLKAAASAKRRIGDTGALTASEGSLSSKAANWLGALTGDTRQSHRIADTFRDISDFTPLAGLDVGQSMSKFKNSPNVQDGINSALGMLDITPVGKAAGALAGVAMPVIKKATRRAAPTANDMVDFRHYSHSPDLTEADPAMWLNHPNTDMSRISRAERQSKGKAPDRVYIGLNDGPKPYKREETVVGPHEYTGQVERSKLYDMNGDPDGFKASGALIPQDNTGRYLYGNRKFTSQELHENLIKDAGYKGYWTDNDMLGRAGVLFDKTPLTKTVRKPEPRNAVLQRYINGGGPVETNTLHSPYSTVKMAKSHDDQTSELVDTHDFSPAPVMRPEDFPLGSKIVPLVGDRTAAGRSLIGVDGRKLSEPLPLEGGARYPHFQADNGQDAAWASHSNVTSSIAKNVQRAAADGTGEVHGVYSAMGPRSGDFSTMMADAVLRQLPEAPIAKGALRSFDDQIRQNFPDFAGISDPSKRGLLEDQLRNKGALRLDFVKLMDDAKRQAAGFPDIGATRYAITDPALRHVPEGTSGLTIAKMDTGAAPTSSPVIPHTSYPSQLKGAFSGGFEVPVAREDMFSDFFNARRTLGKDPAGDRRAFEISALSQNVDQKWIDNLSTAIERQKASGAGW